jgi:hypothetical protein
MAGGSLADKWLHDPLVQILEVSCEVQLFHHLRLIYFFAVFFPQLVSQCSYFESLSSF